MVTLKPSLSVILDTRRANKDKNFPVKLRAIFLLGMGESKKQVNKYYPLGIACSIADFKGARGNARTALQKDLKRKIVVCEAKGNDILQKHDFINVEIFEREYLGVGKFDTVAGVFDVIISNLNKSDRVGSATVYNTAKNRLITFAGDAVTFYDISISFLKKYEAFLKEKEVGVTTIGIYMRHLRAVFNYAISKKLINSELYPFGRGGYLIRKGSGRKIALSEAKKNELLLIQDPEIDFAVDMWRLSYYCYGLNMVDVALMKVGDIKEDLLIIGRAKKKNTDTSGKMLVIPIRKEVKQIIAKWGNRTLNPKDYVFPVLTDDLTAKQIMSRVHDFVKKVNTGLKVAAKKIGVEKITTYTARHTFATIALRKGASKEFIQDALGHTSMMTTENYLSGFDIESKRAMSEKL